MAYVDGGESELGADARLELKISFGQGVNESDAQRPMSAARRARGVCGRGCGRVQGLFPCN